MSAIKFSPVLNLQSSAITRWVMLSCLVCLVFIEQIVAGQVTVRQDEPYGDIIISAVDQWGRGVVHKQNWNENTYLHDLLNQCSGSWIFKQLKHLTCYWWFNTFIIVILILWYFVLYEKKLCLLRIKLRLFYAMFSILFQWYHIYYSISVFTNILNVLC